MSDDTTTTQVDGNVTGSVQSGAFQGPVQTVNVNLPPPVPPPPETATHGERIRFLTAAMMQLQSYFVADRNEREARQREIDQNWQESAQDRAAIRKLIRFTLGLVALSLLIGLANFLWTQQIITRLGWLW